MSGVRSNLLCAARHYRRRAAGRTADPYHFTNAQYFSSAFQSSSIYSSRTSSARGTPSRQACRSSRCHCTRTSRRRHRQLLRWRSKSSIMRRWRLSIPLLPPPLSPPTPPPPPAFELHLLELHTDTDMLHGDLSEAPHETGVSLDTCCEHCLLHHSCVGLTLTPAGDCWLKSSVGQTSKQRGLTSAIHVKRAAAGNTAHSGARRRRMARAFVRWRTRRYSATISGTTLSSSVLSVRSKRSCRRRHADEPPLCQ